MTDIERAYAEFRIGSAGFCQFVSDHCGYEISRAEIEAIAAQAATADEFENIWQNGGNWWAA